MSLRKLVSKEDYEILLAVSRLSRRTYRRGRNPKRQWKWDLWPEVIYDAWLNQNGRCAVTGLVLDTKQGNNQVKNPWGASVDRIDSKKGYVKNNIRLVCHWYNNAKNTWNDDICFKAMNTWLEFVNESKKNQKPS